MWSFCQTNNLKDHDLRGNVYVAVVKNISFSIKFGEVVPDGRSECSKMYFLKNGNLYKEELTPEKYKRFEYDTHNNLIDEMSINVGGGQKHTIGNREFQLNDTTEHKLYQIAYDEYNRIKDIKCFRDQAGRMEQFRRIVYNYSQAGKKIVYRNEVNIEREVVYEGNKRRTMFFNSRQDRPDMTTIETLNASGKPIKYENIVGNNFGVETWTITYNQHGDEVKIIHQAKIQGRPLSSIETIQYEYDIHGNWIKKMRFVDNELKTWTEREIFYASSDSDYSKIVEETGIMEAKSRAESETVFNYYKHIQDSIRTVEKAFEEDLAAKGPIYEPRADTPGLCPLFPGDTWYERRHFNEWINSHIQEIDLYGKVDISFVVECDGSITYIEVSEGPEEEKTKFVRLLETMPKWIPAKKDGQPVRSRFRTSLRFY